MWSFSLQLHENHTFQDHQLSLQNPRDVFLFVLCDPLWPLWQATPSSFMKVPPSLVLITVPSLYFPPSSLPAHHIYKLLSSYSFFSTYPWYLLLSIHWSYSLCYLTFSTVRPVYPTTDSHFYLDTVPLKKQIVLNRNQIINFLPSSHIHFRVIPYPHESTITMPKFTVIPHIQLVNKSSWFCILNFLKYLYSNSPFLITNLIQVFPHTHTFLFRLLP